MKFYTKKLLCLCCVFSMWQCAFQSDELIEVPNPKTELAVYADLSNENGFSAYVLKKRLPNEAIEWDVNFDDSIIDLKTNKTVYDMSQGPYTIGANNLFDYVKGVQVNIYEDGKFLTELKPEFKPLPHYTNYDNSLKAGKKYQIEIKAPGYPTVTGEQTAVSNVKPISIEYKKNTYQSKDNGLLSEILILFEDPQNESNSYLTFASLITKNKKNGELSFKKVPIFKTDPTSTTNNIISDKSFNGKSFTWRLGVDVERYLKDTIGKDIQLDVSFFPINNDLEKYYRTLEARENNLNNVLSEPISPYSNLNNGIGIFGITGRYETRNFVIK
jgi:Domain of unknown function (DUF4249)